MSEKGESDLKIGDTKTGNTFRGINVDSIWQKYWSGNGESLGARNKLIEHYFPLVKSTATRLIQRLPRYVDKDILIEGGIFGLMDSIKDFDSKRKVKFETYCQERIRGAMLDGIRKRDWVPRLVRSRNTYIEKAKDCFIIEKGQVPNQKEFLDYLTDYIVVNPNLSDYLIMDMDKQAPFEERKKIAKTVLRDSISKAIHPLYSKEDEEGNPMDRDLIADINAPNPVTELQKKQLKEYLTKGLTRAEHLIMVLYYYEDMTMKEIGVTIDISEGRVSQLHSSILDRMKCGITTGVGLKKRPSKQGSELELMLTA